ncbi:MAG: thioredoxin domain-containing protein [Chloroflexi bacterium]|nr:thioredoxin domain-containing protein [Anaerolineaceae bacterium]NMB89197.1 thioredoxin domain-containing protein [Chloroflexota bacterium]
MGKREDIRLKRQRAQNRQRITIIAIIAGFALLIAAVLIWPSLQPVGDIATPESFPRPNAQGLAMGDPDAPVHVEEFADFQCPGCQNFWQNMEHQIVTDYVETGKAYFTFTPLSFIDDNAATKESDNSAAAAYCAGDQNKFWEYHDFLFANQTGENIGAFNDRRLSAFASEAGLDSNAFNQCYNGGKYKQQVIDNMTYSQENQVYQTPSFLVNGTLVTADLLAQTIDAELAKAQ